MKKMRKLLILLLVLVLLGGGFVAWTMQYYRADGEAQRTLDSDETVQVLRTGYGWLFAGQDSTAALIFYPGAKVDPVAYAPLLHRLAAGGLDVCLVQMPLNIAFFGEQKARAILDLYNYDSWYIGGHSLGGTIAAFYAARNPDRFDGLVLCASYPFRELGKELPTLLVWGSEDEVLSPDRLEKGRGLVTGALTELEITGGNHAQFGNYGAQKGDGAPAISAAEQQAQTAEAILQFVGP